MGILFKKTYWHSKYQTFGETSPEWEYFLMDSYNQKPYVQDQLFVPKSWFMGTDLQIYHFTKSAWTEFSDG